MGAKICKNEVGKLPLHNLILAADGGVFFKAAIPGEAGHEIGEDDPEGLNEETAEELWAGGFAHIDTHRKVKLVREGRVVKDLFKAFWQDVEREEMTAGDVFEGEKDEDECGDFEDPKGEHGHGVGGEELEHGGHDDRNEETAESGPVGRQDEILAEAQNEYRQRNSSDGDVGHAPGKEKAKTVNEVVNGFEKELADIAVFDVGGDLPVILIYSGERIDDGDQQVIGNHLGERVGADAGTGTFARVDGAPDVNDGDERNEAEERAGEKVETVREVVLNADVQDMPVLFHEWWGSVTQGAGDANGARRKVTCVTKVTWLHGGRGLNGLNKLNELNWRVDCIPENREL